MQIFFYFCQWGKTGSHGTMTSNVAMSDERREWSICDVIIVKWEENLLQSNKFPMPVI